jgi:hypothetical protein
MYGSVSSRKPAISLKSAQSLDEALPYRPLSARLINLPPKYIPPPIPPIAMAGMMSVEAPPAAVAYANANQLPAATFPMDACVAAA